MAKVIWTEKAIERIEEICAFIGLDSKVNATKFALELFEKEELILNHRKIGKIVPEYEAKEYRQIIHGNYRLVYQIIEKEIFILTVRYCKQSKVIDDDVSQ